MAVSRFNAAEVRLLNAVRNTDRPYTYLVGELNVNIGSIVGVPFGNSDRKQFGVVFNLVKAEECGLKKLICVLDEPYSLTPGQLRLSLFLSERLCSTVSDALKNMLPSGLTVKTREYYAPVSDDDSTQEKLNRTANELSIDRRSLDSLLSRPDSTETCRNALRLLKQKKLIVKHTSLDCKTNVKTERFVRLITSDLSALRRREAQRYRSAADYLLSLSDNTAPAAQFKSDCSVTQSGLTTLCRHGIIEIFEKQVGREAYSAGISADSPKLSSEQSAAFLKLKNLLQADEPKAALLYGVTGSGKTAVMLKLVEETLSLGKKVIFLVPEISLTGNAARTLIGQYGDLVTVIHSGLSEGERHDAWTAVREGKKRVVLGTRSAVFCPAENVGLVIMDEEHDHSYKSETQLRYHARDAARYICFENNALLLLASATPDVTSFYKALSGVYELVSLPSRFGTAALPEVRICDLRYEDKRSPECLIGNTLLSEIDKNLSSGEQSILFMNRRGYRSFMLCHSCGSVIKCPNCSVSLTLHLNRTSSKLMCHYCGYELPVPDKCPSCQSRHLGTLGSGTQKLEEELKTVFPKSRILRMDADTVTAKNSHDRLLESFRAGEADILIGTQMVAKGHDFPNVTLVGAVMADASLFMSDYRAFEKTFSLLTQVIGRAGRAKLPGRAVIQSYNPEHEIFALAARQDYRGFYDGEIKLRKSLLYPPFCDMAVFMVSDRDESELSDACRAVSDSFEKRLSLDFTDVKAVIYGPFEAQVYKLNGVYRKKFIIKYKDRQRIRDFFRSVLSDFSDFHGKDAKLSVDINPEMI